MVTKACNLCLISDNNLFNRLVLAVTTIVVSVVVLKANFTLLLSPCRSSDGDIYSVYQTQL